MTEQIVFANLLSIRAAKLTEAPALREQEAFLSRELGA